MNSNSANVEQNPRVLLVEDDPGVAHMVRDGLGAAGCAVLHAGSLHAGRQRLAQESFDALILDLALPDGSGLDFARDLRAAGDDIPILMLTARDTVHERVAGFSHGADDYLCKPFEVEELAARLQAILRRVQATARNVLKYADLQLDLITRRVRRGEIEAVLSAREAELLTFLLRHPEEVLRRERILGHVWGDEAEDDSNVLNVYVNYLRNKIEAGRYPRIIQTIHGAGYMLSAREPDEVGG